VEYPCYRCQAVIQEGAAFCPHCGAPQIRVVAPEGETHTIQPTPDSSGEMLPPPQPIAPPQSWTMGGLPQSLQPGAIRWDLAWKGALLCGVGAAVLSAIPIVSVGCCLWMLVAGALSVTLYQKQVPGTLITPGMGMRVGALAGVFGFMVNAVVTTVSFVAFRSNGDFRRALQEQMDKQLSSNPDPKVKEMMQRVLEWVATPQGAATMMVLVLVTLAVVFLLFTAAGGALGASLFGRRREFR